MKKRSYPGHLGRRQSRRDRERAATTAMLRVEQTGLDASIEALVIAEEARRLQLLFALLDHYKIPRNDASRWFLLARRLAIEHVPVFSTGGKVGAPKKLRAGASLGEVLGGSRRQGRPGRPIKRTDERYRSFLKFAHGAEPGSLGRGDIKASLEKIIMDDARRNNLSVQTAIANDLRYYQKRFSVVRKAKIPK